MIKNKIKNIVKMLIPFLETDKKIYNLYKKSNIYYEKNNKYLALYYAYKISKKYGCYISPKAKIGKNLILPHPIGIVIGEDVEIGENVVIYQNVTLGRKNRNVGKYPKIGDNVIIYCNSIIIGDINIGDNAIIGCNSIVLKSIEANVTKTGIIK